MPKSIITALSTLFFTIGVRTAACASGASDSGIDDSIFMWIIGGLVTLINAWAAFELKSMRTKIDNHDTKITALETKHHLHHPEE